MTLIEAPKTPTASRIAPLVRGLLAKHGVTRQPASGEDLREAGLTSLDVVNLMLAVEGEFDVFVPTERMTPDQFRTLDSIAALVDDLLAEDGVAPD